MPNITEVFEYLSTTPWAVFSPERVRFLAAGEYNENYATSTDVQSVVVRINHGSQLGLGAGQVEYEYGVLRALEGSGVTPRPLAVDPAAPSLGQVMIMEYLSGRPLDYNTDLNLAASLFAHIHAQPVADSLLVQADPVRDIATESLGLIERYVDHPKTKTREQLLRYYDTILILADETQNEFIEEPHCIVNTEVNSENFIIGDAHAWLVDWEKAVVSCRYQDLGHFLVPTTTLWKTDHRIGPIERLAFLETYRRASGLSIDLDVLSYRTSILERTILLRALSWCYMAWYEYTQSDRVLKNDHTFARINWYLDDIECFLK